MFSRLKHLPTNSVYRNFQIQVRNHARAITGDKIQPLNGDTLTGRIRMYLDNNRAPKNDDKKMAISSILKMKASEIRNLRIGQVTTVLNGLNLFDNKREFEQLIRAIDRECCERLQDLSIINTFDILCSFMNVIPHRITSVHFFHLALNHLMGSINELSKDDLIHLVFYVGLLKKSSEAQEMLRKCLKLFSKSDIETLSKEDLCIICNSTFKTSTRVRNKFVLDRIKLYINDNLGLLNDSAIFVTLIKTLRHNRCQDDDILSSITHTIFFNKTYQLYSFGAICHILALYADYLYYDEEILKLFSGNAIEQLKNADYKSKDTYVGNQPRTKDIKRFLWALSNLNYKCSKDDIENVILPQVLTRKKAGEFDRDPGSLVQIILYLWMMQYRALGLIHGFLNEEVVKFMRGNNLPSQESLNLLLTVIYYEDPSLFQSLKLRLQNTTDYNNISMQLRKRPILQNIIDNLPMISRANGIDKYETGCQVPPINIIGITGYQKKIYKTVNIEVLDEYTCLKNTNGIPTGLMQLKLRLLENCDHGLIVIEKQDVEDCSDAELQQILDDEISMVC